MTTQPSRLDLDPYRTAESVTQVLYYAGYITEDEVNKILLESFLDENYQVPFIRTAKRIIRKGYNFLGAVPQEVQDAILTIEEES